MPVPMPNADAHYLQRKCREIVRVERTLVRPPPPPEPGELAALLARKFRSAALCRAEVSAAQWSQTETRWATGPCGSGAFRFDYAYQRADLEVAGPPPYTVRGLSQPKWVFYTASGMAALACTFLAVRRLWPHCRLDVRADGYPETRELADLLDQTEQQGNGGRVAVIDSAIDTPTSVRTRLEGARLAIFDTSCFAASSGRIGAIVRDAQRRACPLILVRSHTKLDCLGLDYGRLGSIAVFDHEAAGPSRGLSVLISDFVRLTGSAALPLHFPPFAAGEEFRDLTRARIANAMRSARAIARGLTAAGHADVRSYAHGLYVVLFPAPFADSEAASSASAALAEALAAAGLPARHAGSFGFDFLGCDWFEEPSVGRLGIRLSVGDLPPSLVWRAIARTAAWLSSSMPDARPASPVVRIRPQETGRSPPLDR